MITFAPAEAEGATELTAWHESVPPGISPADNQTGWRMALAGLRHFVEKA